MTTTMWVSWLAPPRLHLPHANGRGNNKDAAKSLKAILRLRYVCTDIFHNEFQGYAK